MPFSGPDDSKLPDRIQKMPANKRRAFVSAFNSAWDGCEDCDREEKESRAFAAGNAAANRAGSKAGDLGVIMAQVPSAIREKALLSAQQIEDSDLHSQGRELEPHVTAFFGLPPEFTEEMARDVLAEVPPFNMKVRDVTLFENDDFDVVKADIESDDLKALNNAIREMARPLLPEEKAGDFDRPFQPHLTLGYVQKGKGKKYKGMKTPLTGQDFLVDRMVFGQGSQKKVKIMLKEPDKEKTPGFITAGGKTLILHLGPDELQAQAQVVKSSLPPSSVPLYGPSPMPGQTCLNCRHAQAGLEMTDPELKCSLYYFEFTPGYYCQQWTPRDGAFPAGQPVPGQGALNPLKALGETEEGFVVANYIVLYGGKDLVGEHFTPDTQFDSEATKAGFLPVDWEHRRSPDQDGPPSGEILGSVLWSTAKSDDLGLWVKRLLDRRNKYVRAIMPLIRRGLVGTSSEADPRGVRKTETGQIVSWPLVGDTLTVTPMEPRMLGEFGANELQAIKSAYDQLGLPFRESGDSRAADRIRLKEKLLNLDT